MATQQLSSFLAAVPQQLQRGLRGLDARTATSTAFAAVGTLTVLAAAWVVRDYSQWISLGSGGTPPTPSGYWKMTKFRWHMLRSGDDMKDIKSIPSTGPKYLGELAARRGGRPKIVERTMPQRQYPETIPAEVRERVHSIPSRVVAAHPDVLVLDKSKTEGFSTDAIYAKTDLPGRGAGATDKILGNEVAHVHPAENSLHVWLSGVDARQVIEKGWGERFPLSAMGITHVSWIMLYAPRTMGEVEVVESIVRAGVAWLTGVVV